MRAGASAAASDAGFPLDGGLVVETDALLGRLDETQGRAAYAEAHERWEAHKKQVAEAEKAASEDSGEYSSGADSDEPTSSLASDEALQALREKLTGADE